MKNYSGWLHGLASVKLPDSLETMLEIKWIKAQPYIQNMKVSNLCGFGNSLNEVL